MAYYTTILLHYILVVDIIFSRTHCICAYTFFIPTSPVQKKSRNETIKKAKKKLKKQAKKEKKEKKKEKQEKKKEKEHPKLDDVQIKISAMETATNSTSNTDTSSTTSINKKLAEWTRPHNEVCEVCSMGGELVCCYSCNLTYHLDCNAKLKLIGNAASVPDGWQCEDCLDEEEDMNFKPEKVEISVYEQQRLDKIARNKKWLEDYNLIPQARGRGTGTGTGT